MKANETVQSFLNYVFSGDLDNALTLVDDNAQFISANPRENPNVPVQGTFIGKEGATKFFQQFGEMLIPGDFHVAASFSEGDHVAMYGNLRHQSRVTGRDFISDWALICRVEAGKLTFYHFYEDTAALEGAIK